MNRIAFVYGDYSFGAHRPPIDVRRFEERLMTGTDLCSVRPPLEMARRGHDVALYMDRAKEDVVDGLKVLPFSEWEKSAKEYDVAIATSNPNALVHARADALRVVNRQVARFGPDCMSGWETFVDLVLCPSKWAADVVRAPLGDNAPRFDVWKSGCDLPARLGKKVPGRCVYISSPDRGLHWLLSAWWKIRERAPHASLVISYEGVQRWIAMLTEEGRTGANLVEREQVRRAHYIARALERLEDHGVECIGGGLSHGALGKLLDGAEALLYPLDPFAPTETFGVAVLEAQSRGVVPVLSDEDAFGELWCPSSASVRSPVGEHLDEWAALAARVLTDDAYRHEMAQKALANAARYTWGANAARLEELVAQHAPRKRLPVPVRVEGGGSSLLVHGVMSGYASGDVTIAPRAPFEASAGGGCRAGFVQLMRGLAALGHRVRAFSTWAEPDEFEGVQYRALEDAGRCGVPDALVGYYDTRPTALAARLTIASHHTYAVPFPASIGEADINAAPSDHAVGALRAVHGGRRWLTLPNIVPPDLPERDVTLGRVIYHTSPDRGLHHLFRAWPEIRRRVPGATLHVVGDVEGFVERARGAFNAQGDRARALARWLPAARAVGGVRLLGRVSRAAVHRELREAACFAFPADPSGPCETWSTSVVECMAAGIPVVLAPCDALEELWGAAAMTVRPVSDGGDLDEFIEAVVAMLGDDAAADAVAKRQRRAVEKFTAEHAARILDAAIREGLKQKAMVTT